VKVIRSLFLNNRIFLLAGVLVLSFLLAFIAGGYIWIGKALIFIAAALVIADLILLYASRVGIQAARSLAERLSNGDDNDIYIQIESFYSFPVSLRVIDEVPHQFQRRDISYRLKMNPGAARVIHYQLRPVKRGVYEFGAVNIFASSPLGFVSRRFRFEGEKSVPVYPSYLQMRKYELLAISNRLSEAGIKKIRRIGNNQEFELIKEYVSGDDIRTVNWKATARRNALMVNHYQDEKSQQVYCLIDKSRSMQMPFEGLTLLDYAINASLVISNIAIKKSDKAGLVSFQDKIGPLLPASRSVHQMGKILETLYHQKTAFREADFASLHALVKRKLTQRSLLLLFTNFESLSGLDRQLPYLSSLAQHHVLVVIFFENTEMKKLIESPANDLRQIYYKGVAEKFTHEKRQIVKALQQIGIQAVLTTPQKLTVDTINKYLEVKARGLI